MEDDRQQMLQELNNKQPLVGWFHAYKKDMEQEYDEFENELQKRGL